MTARGIEENDEQQIKKYYGQYVTAGLSFLGKATKNDLLKLIVSATNHPYEIVEPELRRILTSGVGYGFLTKIGDAYLLPTQRNTKYEIDADVKAVEMNKEEPKGSDCEWKDVDDKTKLCEALSDYSNVLDEVMNLPCRLFRNKLLDEIIFVVLDQKEKQTPKCVDTLTNKILHLTTLPVQHADAFTKEKLANFYSTAYELIITHTVGTKLLRYTYLSLDKHIMDINMDKHEADKQKAMKNFIDEVEQLEKGDCEKFRTVYINHLLNQVAEALQQGTEFASLLFVELNVQDNNEELSNALKNFVQKTFMLGKLSGSPIDLYFQFLCDRQTKAPKRKADRGHGRGARRKRRRY